MNWFLRVSAGINLPTLPHNVIFLMQLTLHAFIKCCKHNSWLYTIKWTPEYSINLPEQPRAHADWFRLGNTTEASRETLKGFSWDLCLCDTLAGHHTQLLHLHLKWGKIWIQFCVIYQRERKLIDILVCTSMSLHHSEISSKWSIHCIHKYYRK